MAKFFNPDSPLMQFLTKLADLMILNILFWVSCLPIVTIGAAWTALYAVTLKMVRDQEGSIVKSYFRAFRSNFRQTTVLWLGILALVLVGIADIRIFNGIDTGWSRGLKYVVETLLLLLMMVLQYLFPLIAKFEATLGSHVKNACLLALGYLPKTALMTAATLGAVYLSLRNNLTISIALAAWPLVGFSLLAFGNSGILAKIFEGFLQSSSPNSEIGPVETQD